MTDDLVSDVRFGRVERRRMVTDVLRGDKNSAREGLEKNAWLNQARHGFEAETADRFHLAAYFIQLRNAIVVKIQSLEAVEILGTSVRSVRRSKRFPNRLPNTVFDIGIRRGWNWRTRLIAHRNLGNGIAAGTIFVVSESRMVGIKLQQRIAIETHVDVVGEDCLFFSCCYHFWFTLRFLFWRTQKNRPPIRLGLMAGFRNLVFGATSSEHADSPSPDRPSQWRAGRNSNNSDEGSGS